jgi:hypothetical protein
MKPRNCRTSSGVVGRGQTYQRFMEEVLGDLHLEICFFYLDDLIIFSKTYEEHFDRIKRVLQWLRESGVKLSPKKCTFFQVKVKYISHIVYKDGIEPDAAIIEKVTNWPRPTTPEEVRQFLGFICYYRKLVKDCSWCSTASSPSMYASVWSSNGLLYCGNPSLGGFCCCLFSR